MKFGFKLASSNWWHCERLLFYVTVVLVTDLTTENIVVISFPCVLDQTSKMTKWYGIVWYSSV